jgi:hypothetical protein
MFDKLIDDFKKCCIKETKCQCIKNFIIKALIQKPKKM